MKGYWGQPSLFRDFTLLSAAVIFVLLLLSSLVAYTTYTSYSERIITDLEKESQRIERTLASEMQSANYMLTALGRQIIVANDNDLVKLARILKSFDNSGYIYSIFSWVSTDQQVVVSSNKGVLDEPVNISDRDYVKKSFAEPWKMHIGRPIEGRVSGRWVVPVAMGLTDYTGKLIGTIMISIDINSLTEKLTMLVKREGISFAIMSKTLLTLTQVSDDKDFVSHNFPNQQLSDITKLSDNQSGVITQGSLFFGTDTYSYYRVSQDYPYVILLSYDSHYSTETLRGMLWSRIIQFLAISSFLVIFLWIMRNRIIKPVLKLTAMATGVAKGETGMQTVVEGPEEIRELSKQIYRIGEYIDENRRVEDELRNKAHILRKAKGSAELNMRSKTEFLAYVCQEMRNPLNNIVGFAQVMRDQLYGPIENRKYRQYASDIYQSGNTLLNQIQDLLMLSKAETDYVELTEKPVDVQAVVNKTLRFLADRLQADRLTVKVKMQEPLPRLVADEFRLQQIIMNIMLYAIQHMLPESTMSLEALLLNENKDRQFFAIVISTDAKKQASSSELSAMAEELMRTSTYQAIVGRHSEEMTERSDLSLELSKALVALHHGYIDCQRTATGVVTVTVFFTSNRIRFMDHKDTSQ